MRVYEFAKKMNISNKELLALLKKNGFEFSSHMKALTPEALAFLERHQKQKNSTSVQQEEKKPKEAHSAAKKVDKKSIKKNSEKKQEAVPDSIEPQGFVIEPMTVGEFANRVDKQSSEIILTLLRQGVVCTKNQLLKEADVERLAKHYELDVVAPEVKDEALKVALKKDTGKEARLPIIAVVGHVDHGKTTLLDFIRKTRTVEREKGGITQHLGAYEAKTDHGNLIFLDTPGHAAFSKMRARGVKAADIAILIVAADDGVMPQTVEAIKHAKAVDVPIIVAANKMDKVGPEQVEKVKSDLAQYDLLPEDWGGETVVVPISAKTGEGVDQLLEMIALQSEMMDLRTDTKRSAAGFVLESKLEKGLGPVATVICQYGVLRMGDYFAAGSSYGKVSALIDSFGKRISEVGPSKPVQVAGFSSLPDAGDYFEAISKEKYLALKSSRGKRTVVARPSMALDEAVNLILKVDSNSTKEALVGSIEKIAKKSGKDFNIVHSGVGDISESDVMLAVNTGSLIYGLHVKMESNAAALSQKNMIKPHLFDIIYKLLEDLETLAVKKEDVKMVTRKSGEATVLRVFDIKNLGVIAGCIVNEGVFSRDGVVKVYRGRQFIGEGPIKSLQRAKKTVKEVHAGYECGFLVEGFNDFQPDDRVECYITAPETK